MDRGRAVVDGAVVDGSFNEIGVVATSFDNPWVGAMASWRAFLCCYLGERVSDRFGMVVRGKNPPVW
jgi:hypothetical protein